MNLIKKVYYFLGSIYFALFLIGSVTLFTIAGTFLESKTTSHQYAAYFTYESPFFILLLWGFFLNILISALRRWPFKMKHAPFLITHFGLLMILGGALVKSYWGIQGSMHLIEGTASNEIVQLNTQTLQILKRDEKTPTYYELKKSLLGNFYFDKLTQPLNIEILKYYPHSSQSLKTWIKGDRGSIFGLKPFPVYTWKDPTDALPISSQWETWNIYAFRTAEPLELAKAIFLQGMQMHLTDRLTKETLYRGPLNQALEKPIHLNGKDFFFYLGEFQNPKLTIKIPYEKSSDEIEIPLMGNESLLNLSSKAYLGHYPFAIDLERTPSLLFIEDNNEDTFLFAFDAHGNIHNQIFQQGSFNPIVVYDKGFGGYAVQAKIPFGKSMNRLALEDAQKKEVEKNLKMFSFAFQERCSKEDLADFLVHWNNIPGWLYPEHVPLTASLENMFVQSLLSPKEQHVAAWISKIFHEIEPQLVKGKSLQEVLKELKWPVKMPQEIDEATQLNLLTQQIIEVADLLPPITLNLSSPSYHAHLFTAYLRAYGIHWSSLVAVPSIEPEIFILESPISPLQRPISPIKKIEDRKPMIQLKAQEGKRSTLITLSYDPQASNFRWPIFNGDYQVRFQPKFIQIPYKIRLRNARQINYTLSSQPYSYEGDLIITDTRIDHKVEKTISMNHVHETWDGYRFYLANISPADETSVRHVQIVVNRDPAKYWLTYPGAFILSFGILLLFWLRPYK